MNELQENRLQKIVIVGGGTAGWMTAAALSRFLHEKYCSIILVESEQIGTVGVGEATIPAIHDFNQKLRINEQEFMRSTNATFKLGIEFENWSREGESYIHPFGHFGQDMNGVGFHHYWNKMRQLGDPTPYDHYCLAYVAAKLGKFKHPAKDSASVFSSYFYAFHFDASLYAKFLRGYSEQRGVVRKEGRIVGTQLRADDGFIESVKLENDEVICGDLFIDCSGFRGLLIEEALNTGYEEWTRWLPCDRAVAIPSENTAEPRPYTRAIARSAGWQWQIPLQNRTGNGHVYCSSYYSDDLAEKILSENLPGKALNDPRILKFTTGKRKHTWNKNCIAIGLSGGFLEPLESTSIYLIQAAIMKLLECFPDKSFKPALTREFNAVMDDKFIQVRDFLIFHYKANQKQGLEFWDYCQHMEVPDSLSYKMRLFHERGQVAYNLSDLFVEANWVSIFHGQHLLPKKYDPRVECLQTDQVAERLRQMKNVILKAADSLPSHAETISQYCAAPVG